MTEHAHGTDRVDFIDNMKAIGIVLIVAGHAAATPSTWVTTIYAFHVPLFFWVSGYLLARDRSAPSLQSIRQRAALLLRAYTVFFALSWLYWLATFRLGARATRFAGVAWYEPLGGFLTGRGEDLFINMPLWFFPCLLVTQVLYGLLRQHVGVRAAALLLLGLALAIALFGLRPQPRWPWGLDAAGVALGFFALGAAAREAASVLAARGAAALLALAAAAAALGWLGSSLNGRVDLNVMNFGQHPWLYLPNALLGIALCLAVARLVPGSRLARWLSRNSLVIFPTHELVLNFLSGSTTLLLGLPHETTRTPLYGLVTVSIALAAASPLRALLQYSLPPRFASR